MKSYYRKQLAYIHDTYYGDIARNAAQEILKCYNSGVSKKVVDLGCGSGILASILSQNEMEVTGIDISKDLLEIAQIKAPNSVFIQSSIYEYKLEFADIVCAIGEPFNYLFDDRASYEGFTKLVSSIYECLAPSGLFLFDLLTNEVENTSNSRLIEKEDVTMFLDIEVNSDKTILTRKMIVFVKDKNCYEKDAETHRQLLFSLSKIENILTKAGFTFEKLHGYGELVFRKGHYGFLCKK